MKDKGRTDLPSVYWLGLIAPASIASLILVGHWTGGYGQNLFVAPFVLSYWAGVCLTVAKGVITLKSGVQLSRSAKALILTIVGINVASVVVIALMSLLSPGNTALAPRRSVWLSGSALKGDRSAHASTVPFERAPNFEVIVREPSAIWYLRVVAIRAGQSATPTNPVVVWPTQSSNAGLQLAA